MNIVLWVIQGFLSAFFIMPGIGKIRKSKQEHVEAGHLKAESSIIPLRILGVLEVLGCIGIIFPWLIGFLPILTPITAVCFCLIMFAGVFIHIKREQYKLAVMLAGLFVLSAGVAYFRFNSLF